MSEFDITQQGEVHFFAPIHALYPSQNVRIALLCFGSEIAGRAVMSNMLAAYSLVSSATALCIQSVTKKTFVQNSLKIFSCKRHA